MSSRIHTILIIGATAGIGEAMARRFHAQGKTVIATGRNAAKLQALSQELPGLKTYAFDISDIEALPSHISRILRDVPDLDTALVNAGTQTCFNLFQPSSSSDTSSPSSIAREITTNLTAPTVLVTLLAPHLASLASTGTKKTTLFLTSSSLAYIPLSFYPAYCASKAGVSALARVARQQLGHLPESAAGRPGDMAVVELVPPYTDTGLDAAHRDATVAMQGGEEKAFKPMGLGEYVDAVFEALEGAVGEEDGNFKKGGGEEIGVGFGAMGAQTWRGSFGKVYEGMGMST